MRAGRLVALLLRLQQQGGVTAATVAAELEVSVRTIYRDVAALQEAGVPLWTETGPGGGIRLLDGWRTELDGLTGDEAGALLLAGAPGAAAELGLGTVLVAAQAKILATLPPELRTRATRVRQRFHLDAPGWFHHDEPMPHLAPLATAVWDDRSVEIIYGRRDREVRRLLDPLGLVVKAGVWYLAARHDDDLRTYRVSRITACELQPQRFQRPTDFDLATWWNTSAAEFDSTLLRETVTLRLSPLGQRRLPHAVGKAAADAALAVGAPPRPEDDAWVTVELGVESEEVALHQLTALGAAVEVLAPLTLRAAMAATGAAMAQRNQPVHRREAEGGHDPAPAPDQGPAPTSDQTLDQASYSRSTTTRRPR